MELNQISRAFYLGYLWSLGRRFAMDRAMAQDAKRDLRDVRWVTINGTHVPISKKTGKIIGHLKDRFDLRKSVKKATPAVLKASNREAKKIHINKTIPSIYGEEISKTLKGLPAVKKLIEVRRGHIKNAFYKEGIGNFDAVWGDEKCGIAHIIRSRSLKSGGNPIDVFLDIDEVIKNGRVLKDGEAVSAKTGQKIRGTDAENWAIYHEDKGLVIVTKSFKKDGAIHLLMSSYKPNKSK